MDSKDLLVTAYSGPDLDGYASVYGYTEYLKIKDKNAIPVIFGEYQPEVDFVLKKFQIAPIPEYKGSLELPIIIVDASDVQGLHQFIKPENVTEIIDHRLHNDAGMFPNALTQIEFVGSAATLITEKFIEGELKISNSSAALLYSAIISNTLNFQAGVTTERDRVAANWLNNILELDKNYAWEMFEAKTKAFENDLAKSIAGETAKFVLGNISFIVSQLEVIGAEKLLRNNQSQITALLGKLEKDRNAEMSFLSISDIKNKLNVLVAPDIKMQRALSAVLSVTFNSDGVAKRPGLIMRKEIVPLLKGYFNNHAQ